jgi:hypothetical protein
MKHLKEYKIFENKEEVKDLDFYLDNIDSSKEDIQDIFIDFIQNSDSKLEIKLDFLDTENNISYKDFKKLRKYIPRIVISLRNDISLSSFEDTKYISDLYFSLDRFYSMYSDKLKKIEWRMYGGSGVYIYCLFDQEINESIPDISYNQIKDLFQEFVEKKHNTILNKDFWRLENTEYHNGIILFKINKRDWLLDQESKILADKNYAKGFGDYMINNEDDSLEIIMRTMDFFEEFLIKEKKIEAEIKLFNKSRRNNFLLKINGVPLFDFLFTSSYEEYNFKIGKFFKKIYHFALMHSVDVKITPIK